MIMATIGTMAAGVTVISTVIAQISVKHIYLGIATGVLVCARAFGGDVATITMCRFCRTGWRPDPHPDGCGFTLVQQAVFDPVSNVNLSALTLHCNMAVLLELVHSVASDAQ